MGWLNRLLGREVAKSPEGEELAAFSKGGWTSIIESRWAPTTYAYLDTVGKALGVANQQVVPSEHSHDLRGTVNGYPLEITVGNTGDTQDITFRYADLDGPYIDLELDVDMKVTPSSIEPWDASDKKIVLAPQIFVEGSSADEQVAAFRDLPADLQARVLSDMRRLRIRYFRSRRDELDISMVDDAHETSDPVQWLVDTVKLAVDVSIARGAVAPGQAVAKPSSTESSSAASEADARARATALAEAISKQLFGAKVVERTDDEAIDVRWAEAGAAVRIVLDWSFNDVEIEARAPGARGDFTLVYDEDVTREAETSTSADPWDNDDHFIFFGTHVFVNGRQPAAKAEAAILNALGPTLLSELVKAIEEHDSIVSLDGEILELTLCEITDVTDSGAAALRVARLLARVANALPRH